MSNSSRGTSNLPQKFHVYLIYINNGDVNSAIDFFINMAIMLLKIGDIAVQ